jgi:hypothetical protein
MNTEYLVTYLVCAALAGLAGWLFRHSVDRSLHLDGRVLVSEEVFAARMGGLEDRLRGEIAAVKVKLEDMEQFTHRIDKRLEKIL